MEKEFVPYELSLKLKALGFDEPCFGMYCEGRFHRLYPNSYKDVPEDFYREVDAPTFSQAFRWFDHSTEWSGFIVPSKEEGCFEWWIQNYEDPNYLTIESDDWYREREEAELVCLTKLIEIVESKSE